MLSDVSSWFLVLHLLLPVNIAEVHKFFGADETFP